MRLKQIAELVDELLEEVEGILKESPPDRIFWHLKNTKNKLLILQEILKKD